ncbi:MAG TPA: hypothetical protein VHU44_05325 [Acidobacteriaceae bacterium]|jgi:hypothetical protein|nr:hypothetical protein [Acidobacteriaceae bacterium]
MLELLFSWEVTSVVAAFFAAAALAVLAMNDFRLAKALFLIAAVDAVGGIVVGANRSELNVFWQGAIVFLGGGLVCVLLLFSLRYVDSKKAKEPPGPTSHGKLVINGTVTFAGDKKQNESVLPPAPLPVEPRHQAKHAPPLKPVPPAPPAEPDVTAKIVYADEIALVLLNHSQVVVKNPTILLMLFDLDGPADKTPPSPLPINLPGGDGVFIKPGSYMIPLALTGHPNVKNEIKKGDRIVGWFSVTCPDCTNTNVYWVYAIHGSGGWYAPCEKGQYPQLNAITKNWGSFVKYGEAFLGGTVPIDRRIPIADEVP